MGEFPGRNQPGSTVQAKKEKLQKGSRSQANLKMGNAVDLLLSAK
jgi:hypothetical protein